MNQDKSMDKKEIAEEEEREKMLNAENTKHISIAASVPDLEFEEQKPKKKIPIGGIKMPGFCRTKSKEPCKVQYDILISRIFRGIKRLDEANCSIGYNISTLT